MSEDKQSKGVVAVLRVRGKVHLRQSIEDALATLNLRRVNNCVLLNPEGKKEILNKVKDYVTWGEVDEKTVAEMLKKRGRTAGDKPLSDEYVKKHSKHSDVKAFANAVSSCEARLKDVEGLKPFFRMNPPRKGFERRGIKKSVQVGGALGYRGRAMVKLVERMV